MTRAIIFDCFGVLYPDTYWTMVREFLGGEVEKRRPELQNLVAQVDLGHITRDELWAKFAEMAGKTKDEVYERLEQFGGLDKRLLKFIEDNRDKYKFGMISNVGQGFIERMFVEKPASHYFDSIVLSSEVGLVKPDVRIYELSVKQLGVETEDCVFIDDLEKNVIGAREAGMQAIVYKDFEQFLSDLEKLI